MFLKQFVLAAGITGLLICVVRAGAEPSPLPYPSPSPSLAIVIMPQGIIVGAPTGPAKVTKDEAKSLLREFAKAQKSEIEALKHRQKFELKELKASQAAREKEFNTKEADARHKYFAEHTKGPEKRQYVQDFMARRDLFLKIMKDETTQRTTQQDVRMNAVKTDQAQKLKEFQEFLGKGERPPQRLWPTTGQ